MALVIRSAYDMFPQALRREEVFLFTPSWSLHCGKAPPSASPSSLSSPIGGVPFGSSLINSFGRRGQVLDLARICGSKFGSMSGDGTSMLFDMLAVSGRRPQTSDLHSPNSGLKILCGAAKSSHNSGAARWKSPLSSAVADNVKQQQSSAENAKVDLSRQRI